MKTPTSKELQTLLDFAASLLGESTPRALVIIGAARLEEEVKEIVALAAPGMEADRRSHVFRVELLESLGLFSSTVTRCLKSIARIRNHFAHTSEPVALTDPDVASDVTALFTALENSVGIAASSDQFFEQMIAKIPRGGPPQTWVDENWKRFQLSILALLYHLPIVRCNVPTKPIPIELDKYETE